MVSVTLESMKDILYIANQGADMAGEVIETTEIVTASADDPMLAQIRSVLLDPRFPRQKLQVDFAGDITQSEETREVAVRLLVLGSSQGYSLAHAMATYEPMVYLQHTGGQAQLGMLSGNYATTPTTGLEASGYGRLPSLKFIPLAEAYPLNSDLLPDARMATMLAGATSAERAGVGSELGNPAKDFEHRATILGAMSVGDSSIATSHANHAVRQSSSLATGLTNGRLGNIYVPNGLSEFPGYGKPIEISREQAGSAIIYVPDSFLESENNEAYGVSYAGADRVMLGAGMQALYDRHPGGERRSIGGQVLALSAEVKPLS